MSEGVGGGTWQGGWPGELLHYRSMCVCFNEWGLCLCISARKPGLSEPFWLPCMFHL